MPLQPYRPGVDNYADWLAAVDAETGLTRPDMSLPSAYEKRLAAAIADSEAEAAARSAPAADAFARANEAAAALGEQNAAIEGLRQAVAKLMIDERERAREREAKLERRIVEVERAAATVEKTFETRLVASERRTDAAEARARAAETALTDLRGLVRDDFIRLSDDLREGTREAAAAPAAESRADVGEKLAALRTELGEKIAALSARPFFNQSQVDHAVDAAIARTRTEMRVECDRALEAQRHEFVAQQSEVSERIASLSARPVFDPVQVDGAVADAVAQTRVEMRAEFDCALKPQRREFSAQIAELKKRMETVVGRLPVARVWAPDTVVYQGSFIVHEGSTWQATRDTAQRPGGSDWLLIAKGGRDGVDGISMSLRGRFDLRDCYRVMDVVAYEGQGYIATRDKPGVPGVDDGWLLIAARGVKGEPGSLAREGIAATRARASRRRRFTLGCPIASVIVRRR